MNAPIVDSSAHRQIGELGERVLNGGEITREEALWLFDLETTAAVFDLMSWANRVREHYKGNKIHLCSIVNVKAGGCSENCRLSSPFPRKDGLGMERAGERRRNSQRSPSLQATNGCYVRPRVGGDIQYQLRCA